MNIKKLCEDSHRISKEKGWLEDKRPYSAIASLIHSELSEALEDYRKHKGLDEVYYEVKLVNGATIEAPPKTVESMLLRGGKSSEYVGEPKPCGIPIELADVLIRIAQHCGTERLPLEKHVKDVLDPSSMTFGFEEFIADCHVDVSLSYWSSCDTDTFPDTLRKDPLGFLGACFGRILRFCAHHEVDIEKAVQIKQAYNETRSHRHGNKKI